ncbi:MAG: type II toxin-antitoxin system HicB family antitoxin [Methanocorpusculum sp.]|nr:type II toxin-antitoxin system HicB family antitoxin [Methanocorpusculum sp.]MDD3272109.1 type II toxin-antitoxin system HicB family antitoxin [Syntrophomonadaceae bacterium]
MPILSEYVSAAMNESKFSKLDNGTIYGEIPCCPGVWANEVNLEQCREVLQEVLEEWLIMKLRDHDSLPPVKGIDLNNVVAEA